MFWSSRSTMIRKAESLGLWTTTLSLPVMAPVAGSSRASIE
jgi:hypothetical protein